MRSRLRTEVAAPARAGLADRPGQSDRRVTGLLVVLVVALAVPYGLLGPGWFLDDWETLRNAHFDGWWRAAGADQWGARPGAAATYAVVFGLLARPVLAFGLLTALNAVVAVLLYRVLRRYVAVGPAAAVAVVWALMPNHTATSYWASTTNIVLCVALALGAIDLLARTPQRPWIAAALGTASVLCYELTAPLLLAAPIGLALLGGRRPTFRAAAPMWGGIAAAGLWMVLNWHPYKPVQPSQSIAPVVGANFSWGILPPVVEVVGLVGPLFLAFAVAVHVAPSLRRWCSDAERLALVGAVVILIGVAPFLRYYYDPHGQGDRVNVVSSLGAAMVWAGAAWRLARHTPRALVVVACVWVAGALSIGLHRAVVYADTAETGEVVLEATLTTAESVTGEVTVAPIPNTCASIISFFNSSNLSAALQHRTGDRRLRVTLLDADAAVAAGQQPTLDPATLPVSVRATCH